MARRVVVDDTVTQAYGRLALPEDVGVILFNRLHADLSEEYDACKLNRDAEDETCFRYSIRFALHNCWHLFYFRVNDTQTDDRLFVETIAYATRPVF